MRSVRDWLKPAKPRPKRVLLAWEYGTGRTHYANLLGVGSHLRASGVDCLAALYDNSAADREFAAIGVRTIQNFLWPAQRSRRIGRPDFEVNGFTDVLAHVGLNSSSAVAAGVAHYDGIFSLFKPDLVLCDQAYGAMLAARDHLPVVAIGSCVRLPPIVDGGFPVFPGRQAATFPVPELLASINQGLAEAGRFPLKEIGDLLRVTAVMPLGPAEFDFYAGQRDQTVLPPGAPGLGGAFPQPDGQEVFVYLHGLVQDHPAVLDAIATAEFPTRAYIPNLTNEWRAKLGRVAIEDQPVPVKEIFARSRCVVHQGGEQLTSACLAAGIPQVLITTWLDTRIAGAFVKANGLGEACQISAATTDWVSAAIRRCFTDDDLRKRCQEAAPEFRRRWFEVEPTAIIAARICELLGVDFRQAKSA